MQTLLWVATAVVVAIFIETTYLMIMKVRQRSLKVARGSILLDTCSIMDGRIIDVAKTGIITAEIIIPRSVVREMQLLADKADHDKRLRARKGLDNIRELQRLDGVSVAIVNDGLVDQGGVDERLLNLAQKYDAAIATTDYNLNKVAKVINITVINVNELAQLLRAKYLPGEVVELELIQEGANREQGVGYLEDGTMVVVEDAKNLIGQKIKVEIVRSLQTEAGRMMFAKKVKSGNNRSNNQNNGRKNKVTKVREKVTKNNKIKAAPAFHSDQLENVQQQQSQQSRQNQPQQVQTQATATAAASRPRPVKRRTPKSAEADLVRLANQ